MWDDAAQQVFLIAARKLHEIRPGAERSFLFQTALRVAADSRRARRRRREVNEPSGDSEAVVSGAPLADDLVDLYRARKQLDEILDGMPLDLRAVFVLTEFEQFTMAEIATLLELSPGTVASRLRRARAEFTAKVDRIAAQNLHLEGRR
jgi:RNA polymerase sigma-70 factor (ECF subfamily)